MVTAGAPPAVPAIPCERSLSPSTAGAKTPRRWTSDTPPPRPWQERMSRAPTRSLARERGRGSVSRLSPLHRAFHRAGLLGHRGCGWRRKVPPCRKDARKGFPCGTTSRPGLPRLCRAGGRHASREPRGPSGALAGSARGEASGFDRAVGGGPPRRLGLRRTAVLRRLNGAVAVACRVRSVTPALAAAGRSPGDDAEGGAQDREAAEHVPREGGVVLLA